MTTELWCQRGRGYVTFPSVVDEEDGAHRVDPLHVAQHQAYCATTPHHPFPREAAEPTERPEPAVRPVRFDPENPAVPRHIRAVYRLAQKHGWPEVIMGYSQVPKKRVNPVWYEQVHTLSVMARRPGTWVALFWSLEDGKWGADGANVGMLRSTHPDAKEVLKSGCSDSGNRVA